MTIAILVLTIALLVILITWLKINAFIAFLLVSLFAGLALGIPLNTISHSVNKGIGDTLGSIVIVIVLGAMLGKLVAESGAAQRIATILGNLFGKKNIIWAMALTGFITGIPLYYNVGFLLLIPIVFSVAYHNKLPLVYVGIPMLAALSVMHGFLPPHPSPVVLIAQLHADMKMTFFYGIIIAIPTIVLAGPLFAKTLKKIKANPLKIFSPEDKEQKELPGTVNSMLSSLLPVLIIAFAAIMDWIAGSNAGIKSLSIFLGDANTVMLLTLVIATYTLGIYMGRSLSHIMGIYTDAVKDIAMLLLIIAGAGILKQVLIDSGVNTQIATVLNSWNLPPLIMAWLVAAILRVCLGSATVAGLTAVGIVIPIAQQTNVDVNLLVLSVGAGSLFCSHVNDTGFWMYKEYFGLSIKDTFRSWSLMETIVSFAGLIGVLAINAFL